MFTRSHCILPRGIVNIVDSGTECFTAPVFDSE